MKAITAIIRMDYWNTRLMHRYSYMLLRYSLAVIFFWFGILKPMGISPAAELVANTVVWFSADWFVPFLGWWEVTIGVLLLFRPTVKYALTLLFLQIPGTFLPLVLLPEVTFTEFPYGLTLEGQYIVKNLTLIAAAIAVGGTVDKANEHNELH
jgi:uncharacterized membrane protein YkgB